MTTQINLKNLRAGDSITILSFVDTKEKSYPTFSGTPFIVKAVTLPFIFCNMGKEEVTYDYTIDTRKYNVIRISSKALS